MTLSPAPNTAPAQLPSRSEIKSGAPDLYTQFLKAKTLKLDEKFFAPTTATFFFSSPNLENIEGLSNMDTSRMNSFTSPNGMTLMFARSPKLQTVDLSGTDTSGIPSFRQMFLDDSSLTSVDLSHISFENASDMTGMFNGCSSLREVNGLSNISAVAVPLANGMFQDDTSLQKLDLSDFNFSAPNSIYSQLVSGDTSLSEVHLSTNSAFNDKTSDPNFSDPIVGTSFSYEGKTWTVDMPMWMNANNHSQLLSAKELGSGSHPGTWIWSHAEPKPVKHPHHESDNYGNDGVIHNSKVYAKRVINLYKHSNLTGKIYHYKKVRRINRPRFYVKKIAWTPNGTARYYVKQLNKKRYGWITGNVKFAQNNYYEPRKKPVKFRVIRPSGLREYRHRNLTGSKGHLRYNMVRVAKRVLKDGLQTRFQLKNGRYVSARKNFVIYK